MATTDWIESAAHPPTAPVGNDFPGGHLLPTSTASYAEIEETERRRAEWMVRSLANRHGCDGMCDAPEHTRDAADLLPVLAALGLAAQPKPPELKPQPPGREKRCARCKKTKPLTAFGRRAKSSDGHDWSCKECLAVHYQRRKNRAVVVPDEKQCTKCHATKPAGHFARDNSSSTGLTADCKDCRNQAKRDRAARRQEEAE